MNKSMKFWIQQKNKQSNSNSNNNYHHFLSREHHT